MGVTTKRTVLLAAILCAGLLAISCTSGPPAPQIGTPPFYWSAAKTTFAAGDYMKTGDNLGQLTRTENEFTARALPWRLVLLSGMTQGLADLADTFEAGAKANRNNPTPFRKQVSAIRAQASQLAMQFAEDFQKFQKSSKDDPVALVFSYPTGSAGELSQLKRISSGILVPQSEVEDLQKKSLERAVLLATCRALGAPDDAAKTQQMFKPEGAQAPRAAFVLALANTLYELSQLYTRERLDRPERIELLCNMATEALKGAPESKDSKALTAKIQKSLKKK